jgi:hypothetical protein
MAQATSLLQQAPFDRATVQMLCSALEDGWALMATRCTSPRAEKFGRLNLADGILALAQMGERDPAVLRAYAVGRALTLIDPPSRFSARASP